MVPAASCGECLDSLALIHLQSEQLHDLQLIEADHRLAVDNRHRCALKPLIDQFLHRRFIGADIFLDERNALLR